jgi:hypothetical protein
VARSRKGTSAININFNGAMVPSSAGAPGNYQVLTARTLRGRKKGVKGYSVQYEPASNSVVLRLAKPLKTHIFLTISGQRIDSADGVTLGAEVMARIQ